MHLARFPRVKLCHAPTPLEFMPNLTKHLGGPQLWIKRDDCTGIATGGNKNRKLEFLMGEALAQGATHIVTQGAVQSNHVRQTAAVCAKLGLHCTALLEHRVETNDTAYLDSGNVLMDRMMGLAIEYRPSGLDMNAEAEAHGARMRADGHKVYVIPGGGSNTTGALGYAHVALEVLAQANEMGLRIDHFVHATGSAGTQAGLVVGFEALSSGIKVLGIGVRQPKERQETNVHNLANATAAKLGVAPIRREAVVANCDYVGAGYGIPTPGMEEALILMARHEGQFLDPVYSGKGMAGLIDLIRKGQFRPDENIVFLHTGGQVGLFAYADGLTRGGRGGMSMMLHAALREAVASGAVAGVVAMAGNAGGPIYRGVAGQAAPGLAMAPDTIFAIASMTKAIVSVAAMQLVEQGRLSLDAPLAPLIPEIAAPMVLEGFEAGGQPILRPAVGAITLRQLLTHTAGYGYDTWNAELLRYFAAEGLPRVPETPAQLSATPLLFDPGARWNYGINTDVVGLAVERASGVTLAAYLEAHVTGPLRMLDTTFLLTDAQRARFAAPYARQADGGLVAVAADRGISGVGWAVGGCCAARREITCGFCG